MARIFLIYIDINTGYFPGVHHGLASLAAVVRRDGHVLEFYHLFKEELPEVIGKQVLDFRPDIVAFSVTTNQRKYLEKYSRAISQQSKALQIVGGVHATVDPLDIFKLETINGVCIGEGEVPLAGLLNNLDKGEPIWDLQSFWWRAEKGNIKRNPVAPLSADLSQLPYPDYSIFNVEVINKSSGGWMAMMITRGCPFNCTYCCNHVLRSVYPDGSSYVRIPPVEYAIRMIKNTLSHYKKVKGITFADDLLTWNKKWFKEFAMRYRSEIGLPFICNSRPEFLTEDICQTLKEAGCALVEIGIESGSEWLRKYILNRKMTNQQIIQAFDLLKFYGIKRFSYNILGFPFETKEMMKETLILNKTIQPDMGEVFYFFPYPKTQIYSICEQYALLSKNISDNVSSYFEVPAIELKHVKLKECRKIYSQLKLYLLLRRSVNNLRGLSYFILRLAFLVLGFYPSFFVKMLNKRSRLKEFFRQISGKILLQGAK